MPPVATFPFTYIGKTSLGYLYRPYAIIHVLSKIRQKWQPIEVIIDTGADYTLLPKRYASILGVNIATDCTREVTQGVGGSETVYQHKNLPVKIGLWRKEVPVGFLERDNIPPLLGRLSCLEVLRLVFDRHTTFLETVQP